ncbi:MAG TPA: protein-methionine-sulfoxide reductase heme-binding subunit MsrQ [Terracidiphilus sp.]|nr:protein-methionine-sulfoxide reductase heme-binding subunit MsrQ [Terracidiphilus sp.]
MSRSTLIVLKTLVWIACLAPLCWLVWAAVTNNLGADQTGAIAFFTGRATLRLLAITLAISPIRRLIPRLAWLIRFRRLLGLFAFFYATLHLLTWLGLYVSFDPVTMAADIAKRRYITAGMAAYFCLLPLALTSTAWAIRKLGGKNWSRLHTLIYVAAICGVVHYWWQMKPGVLTPLAITVVVGALLLVRPVVASIQRRKAQATATTARRASRSVSAQ